MESIATFHRALFSTQTPAARQYFDLRKAECFAFHSGRIKVFVNDPSLLEDVLDPEGDHEIYRVEDLPRFSNVSKIISFYKLAEGSTTVFLVHQEGSRSLLSTSLPLFQALLQTYEISEQILDFMCCFGFLNGERELAPPPVRFRWHKQAQIASTTDFELTYVVRFVELNHRGEHSPWSLRQTLVFHRFSTSGLLIFVALSNAMRQLISPFFYSSAQTQDRHPLEIHLIFIKATVATWRSYLVYIAEEVKKLSQQVEAADIEDEGVFSSQRDDRQHLHDLEFKVTDITTAAESCLDICMVMRGKNSEFETRKQATSLHSYCVEAYQMFLDGLDELERELRYYCRQADVMRVKIRTTATLLTNILDLDNGSALKNLAMEARRENLAIQKLTEKSAKDAEAVKVLTIVTLVYLPTTAVLNFFSTAFVDFSSGQSGSSTLRIASNWWVSVVVAVPLTAVTLYIWWCYVQSFVYKKPPYWLETLIQWSGRLRRVRRNKTRVLGRVHSELSRL